LAEAVVRENGCADRVTCIRGDARHATLTERGTVLLSDLRGVLPLFGDAIPNIVAARERLVVPGARLIPRRDTIMAAPCEAPEAWAAVELSLGLAAHGIGRSPVARHTRSGFQSERVDAGILCADPQPVATIDYATVVSPHVDAELTWTVARDARVEGVALWFDAELADGAGFTTAPGAPRTVHGQGFLPFEAQVNARAGDTIRCRVRATLADAAYVWAWDTTWIPRAPATGATAATAATAASGRTMRQSSLGQLLTTTEERGRRLATHVPGAAEVGRTRALLALVDGTRTQAQIAELLSEDHPGWFTGQHEALAWVTHILVSLAETDAD
jgi:protein arginine N-methyltransferase 1